MRTRTGQGRLIATASAEFVPLVEDVAFIPQRIDRADIAKARTLLDIEGSVILTGWPADPESTVRAAAAVLGTRLRWLEAVRERVNYRCPHGVDVHDGERRTHVLRCRTVDAL